MKKTIIIFMLLMFIIFPAFVLTANAQSDANDLFWDGREDDFQATTGLGNADPRQMAAQVVNIMLGFLGVIAVIIILIGGFKWMTAAGNEEGIDGAKKMIGAGVIGLIIILAAFGLAQFVINALHEASGATR